MEPHENPYTVLGVAPGVSVREIKSAYRKAALRYHPDKAAPSDRAVAHDQFAKISHAYEMLLQSSSSSDNTAAENSTANATTNTEFYPAPHQQQPQYQYTPEFHDPFAVFHHVFRQEFGNDNFNINNNDASGWDRNFFDPFSGTNDFFFSNSFGRPPNFPSPMFGGGFRSPFDNGGGGGPFGSGFGGNGMFSSTGDHMRALEENHHQHNHQQHNRHHHQQHNQHHQWNIEERESRNRPQYSSSSISSSSSSSRSIRQANGDTITIIERTQTVNGNTETTTETVVYAPNGTVKNRQLSISD